MTLRLLVRPLRLAALLVALPVTLGVLPAATASPMAARTPAQPAPRVVVADVDTGINPYHEFFHHGRVTVTPTVLAEFGIGPSQIIRLTRTGDFAGDLAADEEVWDGVERGVPYWFEGTNIIGISFDKRGTPILADENDAHGTGTAAAVLNANREAVVVMVEGIAVPEAEQWALNHKAVDIVTTSYGRPGSVPLPSGLAAASYNGTVRLGKQHFGSSDNSPAASPPDGTSGPWWTVAVAGFHEDTSGGREVMSGNVIDFVSDFSQNLPYCHDCERGTKEVFGTSFATPRSAGTASKVLLQARRAAGHVGGPRVRPGKEPLAVSSRKLNLTSWQLRRALEEAAHYPGLGDYKVGTRNPPVVDQAPYLQTGWGILSPDLKYGVVEQALAQLGLRSSRPRRAKGGAACAYNNGQHDLRRAYWDNVALGSESYRSADKNPFVRC